MRQLIGPRSRGRDERGFTMVVVLGVMLIVTLLSIAALSAAQGDLGPGAHDRSRKVSYAAADAGVQNYLFHLSQDPNYWAKCTTGAQPHAVNDAWNGVSPAADPRVWRSLPNSSARYTIELLAANGASVCSTSAPDATMIDASSGTFKIRATGEDFPNGLKRSIVATFKRQSLLDFLYFTDKETYPASLYAMNVAGARTRENGGPGDIVTWGRRECDRYWGSDPLLGNRGGSPTFDGKYQGADGDWHDAPHFLCNELPFKQDDILDGPVHTNDEFLVECVDPGPRFGTTILDGVETSSLGQPVVVGPPNPQAGYRDCNGVQSSAPYVNFPTTPTPAPVNPPAGLWKPRAAPLQLPLTNASLKQDTAPAYRFTGTTKITMSGTTMQVTTRQAPGSPVTMAIPADGVVYVGNDGICPEYTPLDSTAEPDTCGNIELQGNYAANVTFAADNDILIKNSVTRTSSGSQFLLGMIAQNFVRVDHPVTDCHPVGACNVVTTCANAPDTPTNVSIDAAILSLTRSFIVDNWFCGAALGTLTVNGAIAQEDHGPTGRRSTNFGSSGYFDGKRYSYDPKLKYRSPPHFPDPVQAQWRVQTFSEQAPAR
jgi:Tfp pilus assembly protein PilX